MSIFSEDILVCISSFQHFEIFEIIQLIPKDTYHH